MAKKEAQPETAPAAEPTPGTGLAVPTGGAVGTPVSDEVRNAWIAASAEDLGFGRQDVAIPFFRVLQANSPQAIKRGDMYVTDAEQGDFLNVATNRLYKGEIGVIFVPVQFQISVTEWWPRPEPGQPNPSGKTGLVKDWGTDQSNFARCTKNEKNKDVTPEGTHMVLAARYYGFVVDEANGSWDTVAFDLTSTQLKKAKKWNAIIQSVLAPNPATGKMVRPQMWGYSYKITTTPEKNDRGQSWFGIKIPTAYKPTLELPNGEAIYLAGVELKKLYAQDLVRTVDAEPDDGGAMGNEGDVVVTGADTPF